MTAIRRSAGALLTLALGGCSLIGGAPAPESDPWEAAAGEGTARRYGGSFHGEGSPLQLVLELRGPDEGLLAALELPDLGITAWGRGTLVQDRLGLQMRYDGACPGRLRIGGRVLQDGYRMEGELTATDCTGTQEGPVVLLLRPPRGR